MTSGPRRRAVAAAVLAAVLLLAAPRAGLAQDGATAGTGGGQELPEPHIIPRPNSGSEPTDAGDRGGALQVLVFGAVVAALGAGVLLVVRESRRARSAGPPGLRTPRS